MSISKKEVAHIARLARIELTEQEKEKLAGELDAILEFVKKLNSVDTDGVEPLTGGTSLQNETREDDKVEKSLEGGQAEILAQAPELKDAWLKVKAIFE